MDSLAAVCTKHSKDWEERLEKRLSDIKIEDIELGKFLVQEVRNENFISKEKDYYQKYILYDHWSHFILRLAYCRSEELRNWFLTHECDLLRFRLTKQTTMGGYLRLSNFMNNEGLNYEKTKTQGIGSGSSGSASSSVDYYKVDWTSVLPLVKSRQIARLENGFAYVSTEQIPHIITDHFRQHLNKTLAIGQKHWSSGGLEDEEQRLVPLLKYFSQQNSETYTSENTQDGTLTAKNIDDMAKTHFPLCISFMYNHWKKEHHMKHFARLAFWRFLKQSGLSMEDCLTIFRNEAQKYPNGQKQFEKEFAYNIRHAYGKEGKRADYTGFSCQKMINENISSGDCHGCPYKYDKENLESLATKLKTLGGLKNTDQIKNVLSLSEKGHYQLACAKQFEYRFSSVKSDIVDIEDIASGILSPNQYFDKAVKLVKGEIGKSKEEVERVKNEKLRIVWGVFERNRTDHVYFY